MSSREVMSFFVIIQRNRIAASGIAQWSAGVLTRERRERRRRSLISEKRSPGRRTKMPFVNRILTTIALLTTFACHPPAQPTRQTPAANDPVQQPAALAQRCTNAKHEFSVSYPAGWHTNDGKVIPACSLFDPSPIVVPEQSELPFEIAVVIGIDETPFNRDPKSSQWEKVLSVEPLTVRGADAVRLEVEATGEGLAERGMRTLRYVVDIGGGRTLTAATHNASPAYEEHKKELARMMETITWP